MNLNPQTHRVPAHGSLRTPKYAVVPTPLRSQHLLLTPALLLFSSETVLTFFTNHKVICVLAYMCKWENCPVCERIHLSDLPEDVKRIEGVNRNSCRLLREDSGLFGKDQEPQGGIELSGRKG